MCTSLHSPLLRCVLLRALPFTPAFSAVLQDIATGNGGTYIVDYSALYDTTVHATLMAEVRKWRLRIWCVWGEVVVEVVDGVLGVDGWVCLVCVKMCLQEEYTGIMEKKVILTSAYVQTT